jgi:hypothetical protein
MHLTCVPVCEYMRESVYVDVGVTTRLVRKEYLRM